MGIGSKTKVKAAMDLLQSELAGGAEVPQRLILAKAGYSSISKRTLDEAKKGSWRAVCQETGRWYWTLPEGKDATLQA